MTRLASLLVVLAACDFGIGSDPDPNPPVKECAPGHSRATNSAPCMTTMAPSIRVDGQTADWTGIPELDITGARLAFASNLDEESDVLMRAVFAGGPLDTISIELAPSSLRPASGGSDRLTIDAAGIRYEKNDMVLTPDQPPLQLASTSDGFEARIIGSWLTYQGALRMRVVGSRGGGEVLRGEMIDVCFGYRSGLDALPSIACEVTR
ncbi:MAG TPA: hypothetical protein VMZ53_21805 [Kofleriaceae bacterium]|nr:hypothetical protein [Kofleriaceae bacterium]